MSSPSSPPILRSAALEALLREAARQGLDIMDEVLRQARATLQRQIDQAPDLAARDARARVVSALVQAGPELRARYPEALSQAFARELGDAPATTTLEAGPSSIKFGQLELMDEQEVQSRISAARGLQQALMDTEQELAELNTLVSALLGFDQVRPERNPLRPEVYVEALQQLINDMPGDSAAQAQCRQLLVPLLGKCLRPSYLALLASLQAQRVQPVGYAIQGPAGGDGAAGVGAPSPLAVAAAPRPADVAAPPSPVVQRPVLAQQVAAGQLTVQRLHGLVSGATQDADRLVQEVVQLILASISADQRILPPVRELIAGLQPPLLVLARQDLHFFSDPRHPARLLLEELVQHSFAYDSVNAQGFAPFLASMREVLARLSPASGAPESVERVLVRLRQAWAQAEQGRQAQQQAAVLALQQAEKRNQLAAQIAQHIRQQAGTVLVPDLVVEFACGPWAQVMAQAQIDGKVDRPGELDHVALLEDLFWSVRADEVKQQPAQLVKLIPQLVQGLRRGLERIHYPADQLQTFLDQLYALHQGGLDGVSAARQQRSAPAAPTWLAPDEARDSGFMDDLGGVPAGPTLPMDFPSTEPMDPAAPGEPGGQDRPADTVSADRPVLEQLQPGQWIELLVEAQWLRVQLAWINESATLCLFSGASGSNHSMTRRMFERLVAQGQLRLVAQGPVVERAFDAVAELAMRNSVYMDIQADPPSA